MEKLTSKDLRRGVLRIVCVPILFFLAGCPDQDAGAPGTVSPKVTAPTRTAQTAGTGPATSATLAIEAANKARRNQELINKAERTYRSGVDNYRGGHLDAARMDFDSAVDQLLTSGADLKSNPQMAEEFDRLLNAINSIEMDALKQGTGLSPRLEAAPLDAANDVTFPENPALTAKINAELKTTQSDFPLVVNDYVAGFISYFTNSPGGHAHLLRSLERAGKYQGMISRILRQQGVPQDLIYQAVAESGFQPQALNARSGAGGMWQFMPFSGYGLTRNGWFDERFDPEKSSLAYAKYMKSLYAQFGDWYLAMAAYDWGPGNVQKAVMRTGYADFWELYRRNVLPQETKNYVPGIIAAMIMAKNPQLYGLDKLVPDAPVVSDTVSVDYAIDLRLVADVTNATLQQIVALNPSLLRMTTPHDIPFDLHIPPGTHDLFNSRLKEIPEEKRASWRFHTVTAGDSLETIAESFHAHAPEIADENGIKPGDSLDPGDELVIPIAVANASAARPRRYTTRRGDTLITIADRFNVSVADLRRWNRLSTRTLVPGHAMYVAEPVRLAPSIHPRGVRGRSRAARSGSQHTGAAKATAHSSSHRTKKTAPVAPGKSSRSKRGAAG